MMTNRMARIILETVTSLVALVSLFGTFILIWAIWG